MTVLVIDIGSSSTRALLFDDHARPIPGAVASRPHQFVTAPPGAATIEAREIQAGAETCIDAVMQHPAATGIRAVGMATFVGNVLGMDGDGQPLTPIFAYADTRSASDVALLKTQIFETEMHQRTGCVVHTAYLPGRLHWLRRTDPRLFSRVVTWADVGTYLYRQWFGDARCSYSAASWSGLLNRATLDWDEEWLHVLKLDRAVLPQLADYRDTQAGLRAEYRARWPALRNVPFCPAVGDGAAANVGCGCVDPSRIALTVGTTAALRVSTPQHPPRTPDGLWSYRISAELHLIGGATSEGGNIFTWARETLALDSPSTLEAELASRRPDAHGLTFLPLLAGERSPGWATDATGAITGLRLSTTPLDIAQAALEGVALRLALIAEQLAAAAGSEISVIGGGGALASSPAWTQIIANALDRPIHLTGESEITARGAAILALHAIGDCSLSAYPPVIARTIWPEAEHAAILRFARQRQVELYNKLIAPSSSKQTVERRNT